MAPTFRDPVRIFHDTQMTTWWDNFFLSGHNVRLVTQYTKEKSLPGIATKYVCYCSERHQTHKKPRNEKAPTTSSNSTNTTTTSSSSATGESDNCLAQLPDITSHRGQSVRLSYPPQASSLLSGLGEKSNVQPFRLTCLPRVSTTCATSREGKYISSSGSNLTRVSHLLDMCFTNFYSVPTDSIANAAAVSTTLHQLRAQFHMIFLKRASQADMEALLAEIPKSLVLACLLESDLKLLNSGWLPVVIEEILVHEHLSQ